MNDNISLIRKSINKHLGGEIVQIED